MECRTILAVAALFLSGCAALETNESRAWLVLHAVDSIQTFHAAQDPRCYAEDAALTSTVIGTHPSDVEVIGWSVGIAAVNLGVADWLLRNEHPRLAKAWQYFNIADTAHAIATNHSIGIRVGSPNKPRKASCLE